MKRSLNENSLTFGNLITHFAKRQNIEIPEGFGSEIIVNKNLFEFSEFSKYCLAYNTESGDFEPKENMSFHLQNDEELPLWHHNHQSTIPPKSSLEPHEWICRKLNDLVENQFKLIDRIHKFEDSLESKFNICLREIIRLRNRLENLEHKDQLDNGVEEQFYNNSDEEDEESK